MIKITSYIHITNGEDLIPPNPFCLLNTLMADGVLERINLLNTYCSKQLLLARACSIPVGRLSGGRLATTLVATKNDIVFSFFFFSFLFPSSTFLPFPDPVGHFGAPWRPFWIFEVLVEGMIGDLTYFRTQSAILDKAGGEVIPAVRRVRR